MRVGKDIQHPSLERDLVRQFRDRNFPPLHPNALAVRKVRKTLVTVSFGKYFQTV